MAEAPKRHDKLRHLHANTLLHDSPTSVLFYFYFRGGSSDLEEMQLSNLVGGKNFAMAQICASENRDIVSALILKSFTARSAAEQKLMYEQNRPFLKLGLWCHVRAFRCQWYEKKAWLCGSECRQGLSVSHVYILSLGSLLHELSQAIRICKVSCLNE